MDIGTETNTNQFKQVVQSFFRVNPDKNEAHLLAYVSLKSNLDADEFIKWRSL